MVAKKLSKKRSSSKKQQGKKMSITLKNPKHKITGYCVVCRKKGVEMKNCVYILNKNGSIRAAGKCPKCGTGMNTFMKRDLFN